MRIDATLSATDVGSVTRLSNGWIDAKVLDANYVEVYVQFGERSTYFSVEADGLTFVTSLTKQEAAQDLIVAGMNAALNALVCFGGP